MILPALLLSCAATPERMPKAPAAAEPTNIVASAVAAAEGLAAAVTGTDGEPLVVERGGLWHWDEGVLRELWPLGSGVHEAALASDGAVISVRRRVEPREGAPPLARAEIWTHAGEGADPVLRYEEERDSPPVPPRVSLGQPSPDGKRAVFYRAEEQGETSEEAALRILDLATGEAVEVGVGVMNDDYHSWAPDGASLAATLGEGRYADLNKTMVIFDVEGAVTRTITSTADMVTGRIAWSPAGDWIAFGGMSTADVPVEGEVEDKMDLANARDGGWRIFLVHAESGEVSALGDGAAFQDAPAWSESGGTLYFVERRGQADEASTLLMAANPGSGELKPVEGSEQAAGYAPDAYYGQYDWSEVLAHVPE